MRTRIDGSDRRCLAVAGWCAVAVACGIPRAAAAAPETFGTVDTLVRSNPGGGALSAALAARWARPDGAGVLERGRMLQLSTTLGAAPLPGGLGLAVDWIPLAPLELRAGYKLTRFFGGPYSALVRFDSRGADFGDGAVRVRSKHGASGWAQRAWASPVLRLAVGPVVLRSESTLSWYRMSARRGWYWEGENDTLLAERDGVLDERASLLYGLGGRGGEASAYLGPYYELTRAFRSRVERQRLGGLLTWELPWWLGALRPHLQALAGVDLQDRNRRGQPYGAVVVGGTFEVGGGPR